MENELINPQDNELREIKERIIEEASKIIEDGISKMPTAIHLNMTCLDFMNQMKTTMPPDSMAEEQIKWKQDYAIGVIKRAYPDIFNDLQTLPDSIRKDMALTVLEQQIMPATMNEAKSMLSGSVGMAALSASLFGMQSIMADEMRHQNNVIDQRKRNMNKQAIHSVKKKIRELIARGRQLGMTEDEIEELLD
jgi:hypothetical protein